MISVVVSAFNVEKYIEKSINSILNQTYSDIELIIVEDCSTDQTLNIIKSFTDTRIKLIQNPLNLGAGYSRKIGIENATGNYIITIDSDDWIEPQFLENLLNKSDGCDMTFGSMFFDYEDGRNSEYFIIKEGEYSGLDKFELMKTKQIIFLNTCLVKKELYTKVTYDTKRYNEDTPTLAKLLYYAERVKLVEEYGYHYIQHESSLCGRSDEFFKHLCLLQTAIDMIEFFESKPDEYRTLVSINDLFRQMSYLTDESKIPVYQKEFNKAMFGFLKRIRRE